LAHEIENAFFVKEAAWHRLGKVLDAPPNLAVALQRAGLDWTVEERPLFTRGEFDFDSVPTHKLLVRSTDKSQLGIVTQAYRPHQNAEALAWMAPMVESGEVKLETGGSLRGGKRVWLLGRYSEPVDVKSGDTLLPFLLFATGHDGTMATQMLNTAVRVVCANTLRASGVEEGGEDLSLAGRDGKFSVNHIGDPAERFERVRECLALARSRMNDAATIYRAMASKLVDVQTVKTFGRLVFDADYVKALALCVKLRKRLDSDAKLDDAETKDALRKRMAELEELMAKPSRVVAKLVEAFEAAPGSREAGSTVWGCLNAATYYVDHERSRDDEASLEASWFGAGRGLRNEAFRQAVALL